MDSSLAELALTVPLPGSDSDDEQLLLRREDSIDTVKRLHRAEREARDAAEREAARLSQELLQLQGRLDVVSSQITDDSRLARTRTTLERIGCPICMDTMVDAATLACGHSGCLGCLQATLARSSRCPTCRSPHYGGVATNVTLRDYIDRLFQGSTERIDQMTESRLAQAEQLRSARRFDAAREAFQRAAAGAPAAQRESILAQIESLPTHADGVAENESDSDSNGSDSDDGSDDGSDDDSAINRLVAAAHHGDGEAVHQLLSAGAPCNDLDEEGTTALVQAAALGHEDVVALLLRHPGIDVNRARDDGVTPLINAAAEGETEIVEQLLAAGARPDCADDSGDTALFVAANNGEVSVVRSICKKIVDSGQLDCLNQRSGRDGDVTPLMCASDAECVQALVDAGAGLEVVDNAGLTALMASVRTAQCDVTAALISAGARLDARARSYGETALHLAVAHGDSKHVRLLISSGADVNAQDDYGCTPLLHAAKAGRADLVSVLLSKSADPNLTDLRQQSPLFFARRAGHADIISVLTERGAESDDTQ